MSLLSKITGDSKLKDAISEQADKRWSDAVRLIGDQSAYDPINDSFTSGPGIPERVESEYNAMLKNVGRKLWSGVIKVAATGFGKGMLTSAAIVLVGFALVSGFGAVGLGASFASGIGPGLSAAGNLLLGSWLGAATLAIGGTLGAVSDVRKHTNKLTAEMARVEAEGYAIARETNLIRDMQLAQGSPQQGFEAPKDSAAEKECSHCAREMARRETAANQISR